MLPVYARYHQEERIAEHRGSMETGSTTFPKEEVEDLTRRLTEHYTNQQQELLDKNEKLEQKCHTQSVDLCFTRHELARMWAQLNSLQVTAGLFCAAHVLRDGAKFQISRGDVADGARAAVAAVAAVDWVGVVTGTVTGTHGVVVGMYTAPRATLGQIMGMGERLRAWLAALDPSNTADSPVVRGCEVVLGLLLIAQLLRGVLLTLFGGPSKPKTHVKPPKLRPRTIDGVPLDKPPLPFANGSAAEPAAAADDVPMDAYLPELRDWPDRPVLVRCSPDLPVKIPLPDVSPYSALPINDKTRPVPFETPLFKGVAMIRIADLPSSPVDYFGRRKRKMQVAVQGRFKKPLRFDQVFSGQEFSRPLRNIPGRWLIKWALSLIRSRLPDTFQTDAFAPKPYFLSPLISTSQAVRADTGTPQAITDNDIEEENSGLGPAFAGGDVSANARKKFFVDIDTLKEYSFDPNITYTFDYYQQFFRAGLFALDLGVKLLDLEPYVGRQPLLLTMAKTMDTDEYLWKFELWHEKVLESS